MAFYDLLCPREMKSERQMSTKTLVLTIALLAGLVAIGGTTPLLAQSPSFPDFSSTTNLVFNGTALKSGSVLRLNPSDQGQVGSAWYSVLQPVANGFSTTFKFQITNASNPSADGIAFVIQNSQAGLQALGDGGGGIGYQGIGNSLAIEFDTYANPYDPEDDGSGTVPANHLAIQSCGVSPNTADHNSCEISLATAPVNLADGSAHTVQIEYTTGVPIPPGCEFCFSSYLQVTIDGLAVFENPGVGVDLSTLLQLANPSDQIADSAYVGFTGATGFFQEANDILSWNFTSHSGQTITQTNLPPNTFTTFNFGSYLYKVKPDVGIDTLSVTEVPTDFGTFNAGPNFPSAKCIVYDSTGGKCIEFHALCTGATCNNVNYEVVTSYDVPSGPPITNPGFLKATGQDCNSSTTFDSNIITEFLQTRTDPTTKGSSRPSFSCFVAVSDLTYGPADLDIVNLASPKVKQGANLTYVATTTNFGPSSAQGVAISNTIPTGTTYVSSSLCSLSTGCSSNQCSLVAGTASCKVGNMDKFGLEFMLVTVKVTAKPGTVISDTATISSFNPDPDRVPDRSWTMKTIVTK
jgi:uncharacterized repeat protein (TIGR01451 family)